MPLARQDYKKTDGCRPARAWRRRLVGLLLGTCAVAWTSLAAEDGVPRQGAPPPTWSQEVLDTFFPDAREHLQGQRPDYASLADNAPRVPADSSAGPDVTQDSMGTAFQWSNLVRPETLEDEAKRISNRLAESVANATEFKGGSYRACRREFSLLSVIFAVIAEYDQHVRWRDEADAYRDLFARAGFNCQVGSDQSFRQAAARSQDLRSLIRGSRIDAPAAASQPVGPDVADRVPLMQRMEQAHEDRLAKWLAAPSEFHGNLDDLRHEAELLAVLAEVISREGYEFSDEEEYSRFAAQLREGAQGVAEATASQDYQRASRAAAEITDACINCHEWYR